LLEDSHGITWFALEAQLVDPGRRVGVVLAGLGGAARMGCVALLRILGVQSSYVAVEKCSGASVYD
jgi:hypothetical protein